VIESKAITWGEENKEGNDAEKIWLRRGTEFDWDTLTVVEPEGQEIPKRGTRMVGRVPIGMTSFTLPFCRSMLPSIAMPGIRCHACLRCPTNLVYIQ
jgi:hypothetical protein